MQGTKHGLWVCTRHQAPGTCPVRGTAVGMQGAAPSSAGVFCQDRNLHLVLQAPTRSPRLSEPLSARGVTASPGLMFMSPLSAPSPGFCNLPRLPLWITHQTPTEAAQQLQVYSKLWHSRRGATLSRPPLLTSHTLNDWREPLVLTLYILCPGLRTMGTDH